MPEDKSLLAAIQACYDNADELLRAAGHLVAAKQPARLTYHLALLALEEVGKSSILAMCYVATLAGRELPTSVSNGLDDHVRKLFWAIWGPSLGVELITKNQIDSNVGLAQRLHERRLAGLYVDSTEDGLSFPMGLISDEEATSLLNFATACLELGRARLADGPADDPATVEIREWFFRATEDQERRRFVMSQQSLEKLKELGSTHKWVAWLKATLDGSEAEAQRALERELLRQPGAGGTSESKWSVTIRLFTTSHSIRQKPLNQLNKALLRIRFRALSGKPEQLLVDLEATNDLPIGQLHVRMLAMARRLVMALNVSALGYFWFHEPLDADPKQSGRFYDKVVDLDTKSEVRAHRTEPLRLEFGDKRRVLDETALKHWGLCFGHFLGYKSEEELSICERYLEGLGMVARTDAHMSFTIPAVVAFYLALKNAMARYGAWSKNEEFGVVLKMFATTVLRVNDEEHLGRLVAVGESVNTGKPVPHAMTMNDVGIMKTLCDWFLLRTFRELGPGALEADDPNN